jgi:hypothetical protein
MIGRRRRPLLGALVVGGVAGSVAKHEVEANNQKQATIRTTEELQRSEYERQQAEKKYAEDRAAWEREKMAAQAREVAHVSQGPSTTIEGNKSYCMKCGTSHIIGANFCGNCGNKLSN